MMEGAWSKFYVYRSCGLAALANVLAYEGGRFSLSDQEAKDLMDSLMKVLRPRPWGIVGLGLLNHALRKLGIFMGQAYYIQVHKGKAYGKEAYDFIRKNIQEDHPVLVLNTNHPIKAFHNHWITVTGLEEVDGVDYVLFSSWGKRYKVPFDDLFHKKSLFRRMGVIKIRGKE